MGKLIEGQKQSKRARHATERRSLDVNWHVWLFVALAAPVIDGARLLRSERSAATGRLVFVPVGSPTMKDRVRMAAAEVWERTLVAPLRVGTGWCGDALALSWPMADPARLGEIQQYLREVSREADGAAAVVRALPKASPLKIPTLAAGVHATLERLLAIGESERAAHAIVTHLRHEIDSTAAADLPGMARAQAVAYGAAAVRARLLADAIS